MRRRARVAVVACTAGDRGPHNYPQDACNSYRAGYVPVVAAFTLGSLFVLRREPSPLAGVNDSMEGRVRAGAGNLPGTARKRYRVNPFDPFSPWVIPG